MKFALAAFMSIALVSQFKGYVPDKSACSPEYETLMVKEIGEEMRFYFKSEDNQSLRLMLAYLESVKIHTRNPMLRVAAVRLQAHVLQARRGDFRYVGIRNRELEESYNNLLSERKLFSHNERYNLYLESIAYKGA